MFSVYCMKIGGFCPKQAISMKRYFTRWWSIQPEIPAFAGMTVPDTKIDTNVIPAQAGTSTHKLHT
ncbi:hypothetical protein TH1_13690 [Thalassospira lucentensis MCCC 1A00383 = DSM 14000]|nr:hypothetical protein TH1_13690 [Thalassospira lucentensis MCCC 1A00383 = DSM 14000]